MKLQKLKLKNLFQTKILSDKIRVIAVDLTGESPIKKASLLLSGNLLSDPENIIISNNITSYMQYM